MRRAVIAAIGVSVVACESTPILLYHGIGEPYPEDKWVTVEAFRAQMSVLAEEGYTSITASELDAIERGDAPSPPKPILLTFDDGFRNFETNALPVLREHGFRATFFIPVDRIGDSESTRLHLGVEHSIWPELISLQEAGVELQSHSRTHPRLRDLDANAVREEIAGSKRILEAKLGRPITVFAYPGGSFDAAIAQACADAGYESAHSVSAGLNGRYDRQRISIHADVDLDEFRRMIGGTWWGHSSGAR
jgi:peptidoglycan/xylan/chitin deacetylase (PgdA/CDA1 family)